MVISAILPDGFDFASGAAARGPSPASSRKARSAAPGTSSTSTFEEQPFNIKTSGPAQSQRSAANEE
jgi:hypothetical protein